LSKVVLSLGLLALGACTASKQPYIVGTAGPWKQGYGLQSLQAVHLAIDEINAAGGINGHQLKVIERDDEGDGTKAAKIAQDFVNTRTVSAVIGHVNSSGMRTESEKSSAAPVLDMSRTMHGYLSPP